MILVDIHAHLDDVDSQVIERAAQAGVKHIICTGVDQTSNQKTLELADQYEHVHAAIGLYPDQTDAPAEHVEFVKENIATCIAVSECGLDYHITKDPKEHAKQKELFVKHIELANEHELPLIVHSRKAETDCIELLKKQAKVPVILHAFDGNKKQIQQAIDAGFYLTVTPNITRAQQIQIKAEMTPLKQLLTETDTPYLGPNKHEPNEPVNVKICVEQIAKIKKIEPEECANIILMNYKKVFG